MKKQLVGCLSIILISILGAHYARAQKAVFEEEMYIVSPHHSTLASQNVLPVISSEGRLNLVLLDQFNIHVREILPDYSKGRSYSNTFPSQLFRNCLGYHAHNGKLELYFMNGKQNKFFVSHINLEKRTDNWKDLPLQLKKESYLTSHFFEGHFHLFTVGKNTSKIHQYVFRQSSLIEENSFDLTDFDFSNDEESPTLYHVLHREAGYKKKLAPVKIDLKEPDLFEDAAKKIKVLASEKMIFFTLDHEPEQTRLISFDLENNTVKADSFRKTPPEDLGKAIHTNSFTNGEVMFQLQLGSRFLSLTVIDLLSKSTLSHYVVSAKDDKIPFKNGSITFEGNNEDNRNKSAPNLTETHKALQRMIQYRNISVSTTQIDEGELLKIGAYKEVKGAHSSGDRWIQTPGSTIDTPYGTVSSPGSSFHVGSSSENKFSSTNKVYFRTILDHPGYLRKDGFPNDPLDRIRKYRNDETLKSSHERIFKMGNIYLFGYYLKKEKTYILRKFDRGLNFKW